MNSLVLLVHLLNPNLSTGETRNLLIEKVSDMNLENTRVKICMEKVCETYASLGTIGKERLGKKYVIAGKGGAVPMEAITGELEVEGVMIDIEYTRKDMKTGKEKISKVKTLGIPRSK